MYCPRCGYEMIREQDDTGIKYLCKECGKVYREEFYLTKR